MTTPNTDRLYNSMLLLTEKDNGTATLENSLAVSYKAKHATTIWPGSYTPEYLSLKNKNYAHTHLYINVHRSLVTKNRKQPRCLSPGEWLDKLWSIYTMEYCCLVAKLLSVWLFCDPMDCSLPGSSVHETFQARILEWVAILFSRGSSQTRDWTHTPSIGRQILEHWATKGTHQRILVTNKKEQTTNTSK